MSTIGGQSAVQTNVAASATAGALFATTVRRTHRSVFNDADQALYISFSGTASPTNFSNKVAAGAYFEFPQPVFAGAVSVVWAGAPTGAARITEY